MLYLALFARTQDLTRITRKVHIHCIYYCKDDIRIALRMHRNTCVSINTSFRLKFQVCCIECSDRMEAGNKRHPGDLGKTVLNSEVVFISHFYLISMSQIALYVGTDLLT